MCFDMCRDVCLVNQIHHTCCYMVNNDEKKHMRDILKYLEDSDIIQLAKTITVNKLDPKSAEEAVDMILRYEASFQKFLHHKKVSRELLFKYMHSQNIPVLPKDDKRSMIVKLVNFVRNSHSSAQNSITEAVINDQQIIRASSSEDTEQYGRTERNINEMAIEFSKWFYSLMNQESCISIEHFWHDSSVKVHISTNGGTISSTTVNSAEESVQLLWQVKLEHRLFFNPNITAEGVRGTVDVHGLVLILACGSLHIEQKFVGIFEQKFGLIRDPTAQNNWKIKFTELFLRSTDTVRAPPTLHG